MPSFLPGTKTPIENENAYIAVRNGYWNLRMNLPKRQQLVKKLSVRYEGKTNEIAEAFEEAGLIIEKIKDRIARDLAPKAETIMTLSHQLLEEGESGAKLNRSAKQDVVPIKGGRGYWSYPYLLNINGHMSKTIWPYWGQGKYKNKEVHKISQRDVDNWLAWRRETHPNLAPSTTAKQNTVLRHIFKLAQRNGERFTPPVIRDEPPKLRERRRPEMPSDRYHDLLTFVKEKYGKVENRDERAYYLFYCYLETLEHTGIRPPSSIARQIKMSDIEITHSKDGTLRVLLERQEKGHTYTAAASQYWIHTLERLDRFYKHHGLEDREYLFVHPVSYPGRNVIKGEPIGSFRSVWDTAMKHLGWNEGKTKQSERITPYSIRHRFAGKRLVQNEASPIMLAETMGTSLQMIDTIYHHFSIAANYQSLIKDDVDYGALVDVFDERGIRVRAVKRNSKEHRCMWNEKPSFIADAPDHG